MLAGGGRVIDVANGIADQPMDVAIRGDTIAAVEEPGVLPPSAAAEVFDASGLLVMPGLVDLHAHGFKGIGPVGIDFDEACLSRCTTTAMDAGSAGSATFPGFKEFIIDPCKTRVLSFLNISMIGLAGTLDGANTGGPGAGGSNQSLAYMSVDDTVRCIRENRDHVVGVKTLLSRPISDDGRTEAATYAMALEASGEAGVPLMCHHSMSSIPIEECPGHLRSGDICKHRTRRQLMTLCSKLCLSLAAAADRHALLPRLRDDDHGQRGAQGEQRGARGP